MSGFLLIRHPKNEEGRSAEDRPFFEGFAYLQAGRSRTRRMKRL